MRIRDWSSDVCSSDLVWSEVMTTLFRMPSPQKAASRPAPQPQIAALSEYIAVPAAADTGRRYAKVGKDFNPIHLTPFSARMFGFKRHIAHGLWTAAPCAVLLSAPHDAAPTAPQVEL